MLPTLLYVRHIFFTENHLQIPDNNVPEHGAKF